MGWSQCNEHRDERVREAAADPAVHHPQRRQGGAGQGGVQDARRRALQRHRVPDRLLVGHPHEQGAGAREVGKPGGDVPVHALVRADDHPQGRAQRHHGEARRPAVRGLLLGDRQLIELH